MSSDRALDRAALKPVAEALTVCLGEFDWFQKNQSIDVQKAKLPLPEISFSTDSASDSQPDGKQNIRFNFAGREYRLQYDPRAPQAQDRLKVFGPENNEIEPGRFGGLTFSDNKISFYRTGLGGAAPVKVEIDTVTKAVSVSDQNGRLTKYPNGARTYERGPEGARRLAYIADSRGNLYPVVLKPGGASGPDQIEDIQGLIPPLDRSKPITFDEKTGQVKQELGDRHFVTYTPGLGAVEDNNGSCTFYSKDGTKLAYKEASSGDGTTKRTERVFEQTPFGANVKVIYDADGKVISVTDANGSPIPGLEITREGVFLNQGRIRLKLNEFLTPTEIQQRDGKNEWVTVPKVHDKSVVSLRLDENKSVICKLEDGRTLAISKDGHTAAVFQDKPTEDGRLIREFTNPPGVSLLIDLSGGKERVIGRLAPGSSTFEPLKPDEQVDPLTGGTITKEMKGAVPYLVTTLPDRRVIKQEMTPDGRVLTAGEGRSVEVVAPVGQGTATTIVRENADGTSTTETIYQEAGPPGLEGKRVKISLERNKEGLIVSETSPKQSVPGQDDASKEEKLAFEYSAGADGRPVLSKITLGDGRIFQRNEKTGKWDGFMIVNGVAQPLLKADGQPLVGIELNPQLDQNTGAFTMNLPGFEVSASTISENTGRRMDAPSESQPAGEALPVRQIRCQPRLLGFGPGNKPIWAFSAHPAYLPGSAGASWQFTSEELRQKEVLTDQGYSMTFSRTADPACPGKFIQVSEFNHCPNGVTWQQRMADGSTRTIPGIYRIESRWDAANSCYITTLIGRNGVLAELYVTEDGRECSQDKKPTEDGLERVKPGDTRPFPQQQPDLERRANESIGLAGANKGDQTRRQAARDAIGDYRRAIESEICRIRDEVYAQAAGTVSGGTAGGQNGPDFALLGAEFQRRTQQLLEKLKWLEAQERSL
ncbi:MAG: hypothetical protein C5B53_00535 [Candidatus Melainabacteria bacterium]|nr:MAG: hypothetical protein C5B53_00535 [Candidatus Melainabacteria bacterium]